MNLDTIKSSAAIFAKLCVSKITQKRIPLFVSLQITKLCNLRCSYCFAELDSLKSVSDFTTDQWKDIIDNLYMLGTRWVRIQGGEPLIRNDIGELINYIKDKGMICELGTNGTLIKKRIDSLIRLDSLCISLDGDREANDMCRGNGVYDKVVESIKLAKSRGIKVRVHAVLARHSSHSLEHLAKLCREIGVKFNVAYFCLDEAKVVKELALTPLEIKDYYKKYRTLKKEGYPIASSYTFINDILKWPLHKGGTLFHKDFNLLKKIGLTRCLAGRCACFIDSDGNLYPCPKRWKRGINISQGIQIAWNACKDLSCISCWAYGDNEAFAIMSLRPSTIWNVFAYFLPFHKKDVKTLR